MIAFANVLKGFKNTDENPHSLTAKYLYDPGLKYKCHNISVVTTQSKDKESKEGEKESKCVHQYDTSMCLNTVAVLDQWKEP